MKNKNIILLILTILFCQYVQGQESHGGVPLTFNLEKNELQNLKSITINKKELPLIDNTKEQTDAEKYALSKGFEKNKFYGKGITVDIDIKKEATFQLIGKTGKLYLLEITSPSANALQVFFDSFKLPTGGRMFIYNKDKSMYLGSFTEKNRFIDNSLGTQFINGNTLIIEYYEPNEVEFESEIHIKKIVHTFSEHGPWDNSLKMIENNKSSGSCNINVACELGNGWDREKRSVAIIVGETFDDPPYWGFCSGALVNNTCQDGRPLFLTARHCAGFESPDLLSNLSNWIFIFNYETTGCTDNTYLLSPNPNNSVYGAWILTGDDKGTCESDIHIQNSNEHVKKTISLTSDYLLLELNVLPAVLEGWNATYAGWDINVSAAITSPYTVGIHHPKGDIKKISKDNNPPISSYYQESIEMANGSFMNCDHDDYKHWEVVWDQGTTEGGSSGSPLFNSNHKIIGQLHGGAASCNNPTGSDSYGKLSESWMHGGLAFWLDPCITGATSIGTYNPSNINEHCYNGIQDSGETGVDCGGTCPSCDWVNSQGWGMNSCNNGIKDPDEIGIDCGGPCRPCGGAAQCSNCKKDGDETGVDCGGSCAPCNDNCTTNQITYNTTNFPSRTSASDYIVAQNNVSIQTGQEIEFKAANSITLNPGFTAQFGSTFSANITPCDCKQMCPVNEVFGYINNQLCYHVSGYNRYHIKIINRWENTVYENSGYISDNLACVFDHSNFNHYGSFAVLITFYSDCLNQHVDFNQWIYHSNGKSSDEDISIITQEDYLNNIKDIEDRDLKIYPNPTNEQITIECYPYTDIVSAIIYDMSGKIVYSSNKVNNGKQTIDVSKFANGLYLLKINDSGKYYTRKFEKN